MVLPAKPTLAPFCWSLRCLLSRRACGLFRLLFVPLLAGPRARRMSVAVVPGAGAVDPIHFPAPYLGVGGDGKRPGSGRFQYVTAYARKMPVCTIRCDCPASRLRPAIRLDVTNVPLPLGYQFDPDRSPDGQDSRRCVSPPGYVYDQEARRQNAVPLDRQGNILRRCPSKAIRPARRRMCRWFAKSSQSDKNPLPRPQERRQPDPSHRSGDRFGAAAGGRRGDSDGEAEWPLSLWIVIDPAAEVLFPGGKLNSRRSLTAALWLV